MHRTLHRPAAFAISSPAASLVTTNSYRQAAQHLLRHVDERMQKAWQNQAVAIVEQAEEILWSHQGDEALHYLINIGLRAETISLAQLGYLPADNNLVGDSRSSTAGIVFPWFDQGTVSRLRFWSPRAASAFTQLNGSRVDALYSSNSLAGGYVPILCADEIETLLLQQVAHDLVAPVSCGSDASTAAILHMVEGLPEPTALVTSRAARTLAMRRGLIQTHRLQVLSLPDLTVLSQSEHYQHHIRQHVSEVLRDHRLYDGATGDV